MFPPFDVPYKLYFFREHIARLEIENQHLRQELEQMKEQMKEQQRLNNVSNNGGTHTYSAEVVDSLNVALATTCSSLAKMGEVLLGAVSKMHAMVRAYCYTLIFFASRIYLYDL